MNMPKRASRQAASRAAFGGLKSAGFADWAGAAVAEKMAIRIARVVEVKMVLRMGVSLV